MAIVVPVPADLLPDPPILGVDTQATFSSKTAATLQAEQAMVPQVNALASATYQNALESVTQANSATASAATASTAATTATTQAGIATTQAGIATSAATSAAANSVLQKYLFSTTTTMADPGVGNMRFNSATYSSVTAIALDDQTADAGNPNIESWLLTFDDSTNAVKGQIIFSEAGSPTNFAVYNITGLTNNTGWVQLTVAYVTHGGSFANGDTVVMDFNRVGDAGTAGGVTSINGLTGVLTGFTTDSGTSTLTNKTLNSPIINNGLLSNPLIADGYTEEVYTATTSGSVALTPVAASIFRITANGTITFTDSIASGQSLILGLTTNGNTINWPTVQWTKVGGGGTAPTLLSSGVNWLVFWDVGGTLYGSYLGATA